MVYFTKYEISWETFLEKPTGIWNIFKIFNQNIPSIELSSPKEDDPSARVFRKVWLFFCFDSLKFENIQKFRNKMKSFEISKLNWVLHWLLWVYTDNYHFPETSRHQGNNCHSPWPYTNSQFSSPGGGQFSSKFWLSATNYGCLDCPQVHSKQLRHTCSKNNGHRSFPWNLESKLKGYWTVKIR